MSGHSKWHSIKHKKALADSKKSKIFGRLSRDISIAARQGADPAHNAALREAIDRARRANLPQSTIERLLQEQGAPQTTEILEAHGPEGVGLLIVIATDNHNRTLTEIRTILKGHDGHVSAKNSVRWKFTTAVTIAAVTPATIDHEKLELALIDAGALDIALHDSQLLVRTSPSSLETVTWALAAAGASVQANVIEYVIDPEKRSGISTGAQQSVTQLCDELRQHQDVTAVYTDVADS